MAENKTAMELALPSSSELVVRSGKLQVRFHFNAQGGNAPVSVYGPADSDESLVRVPQIGAEVANGWKYGGMSVTTKTPLFVAPKDEPVTKTWLRVVNDAAMLKGFLGYDGSQQKTEDQLLEALEKGTHDHGVRVPTANELDKNLFANRNAIGGFNKTCSTATYYYSPTQGIYWSSTQVNSDIARQQRFSDGCRGWGEACEESSLARLVRS